MKTTTLAILAIALTAMLSGCGEKKDDSAATWNQKAEQVAEKSAGDAPAAQASATGALGGEVLETMNSGGYTYAHIKTATGDIWAAGPESKLEVGQQVELQGAMAMKNFHASSLKRDFDEIWFASAYVAPKAGAASGAEAMAQSGGAQEHMKVDQVTGDYTDISKPAGGYTIAELYADKDQLNGKTVKLRGRVVKVLNGIMGHNWMHVQDGTGEGPTADLTVTTPATVKVGDTVVVEGTLATDKDFGSGYFYKVIVEDANVRVEKSS